MYEWGGGGGLFYYFKIFFAAAWAQDKAKILGIRDLSPANIEKLSGDNTRVEKDRVMTALENG